MEIDHLPAASAPSQTPNQSKPSDQAHHQDHEEKVDDQESSSNKRPSIIRSYECIFCKKGFTNAQALGGHMNIHRKDRNKLKKPLRDTTDQKILQIPHAITKSNNISQSHKLYYFSSTKGTTGTGTSTDISKSREFESCGLKRAATWPVFDSRIKKSMKGEGSNVASKISTKSIDQEDAEVDLELRLGFKSCAGNEIGTRNIF